MADPGRSQGTYSQAVRLLKMLDELRARTKGALLSDLAEEFGVSERQVRRDLIAIEQAGYNLQWNLDERRTRVVLDEGRGGLIHLSLRRRYTLLAARRVFDVLKDTPFQEDIHAIYGQIVASLPPQDGRTMDAISDRFVYLPDWGAKIYDGHADIIDGLLTGLLNRFEVACRYRLADGRTFDAVLRPYAMVLYKQGLYVLASALRPASEGSAELVPAPVHVYAVERFSAAEYDRKRRFEIPPDFKVEHFFDGVFGIFIGGEPRRVVIEVVRPRRRAAPLARQRGLPSRGGALCTPSFISSVPSRAMTAWWYRRIVA